MSRRPKVEWVFIDCKNPDPSKMVCVCDHCGGRESAQLPLPLAAAIAWMNLQHRLEQVGWAGLNAVTLLLWFRIVYWERERAASEQELERWKAAHRMLETGRCQLCGRPIECRERVEGSALIRRVECGEGCMAVEVQRQLNEETE